MRGTRDEADDAHRAALLSLLHWDHLPGLHSTGMAHLQMWVLASREGLLRHPSGTSSARTTAKQPSAKEPSAKAGNARKPADGARNQTKPAKVTTATRAGATKPYAVTKGLTRRAAP